MLAVCLEESQWGLDQGGAVATNRHFLSVHSHSQPQGRGEEERGWRWIHFYFVVVCDRERDGKREMKTNESV